MAEFRDRSVSNMSHSELKYWAKWVSTVESSLARAEAAIASARLLLCPTGLDPLLKILNSEGQRLTHVTERKGSPQTLVCTKARRNYSRRCEEYQLDIAALTALAELIDDSIGECAARANAE